MKKGNKQEEKGRANAVEESLKVYLDRRIKADRAPGGRYYSSDWPIVESNLQSVNATYLLYQSSKRIESFSKVLTILTIALILVTVALVFKI
jgi:hypothetical protein